MSIDLDLMKGDAKRLVDQFRNQSPAHGVTAPVVAFRLLLIVIDLLAAIVDELRIARGTRGKR